MAAHLRYTKYTSFFISILKLLAAGLTAGILFCFPSCNERKSNAVFEDKMYEYIYNVWKCDKRWDANIATEDLSDEQLRSIVQRYFTDSCRIEIDELIIEDDFDNMSDSCGSYTGRIILITALGKYSDCLTGAEFSRAFQPSDRNEMLDYIYHISKCDKRWNATVSDETLSDEELRNAVHRYLTDSLKITVDEISVWGDATNYALDSCGRYSGRSITVTALGKYSGALNTANFFVAEPGE